MNEKLLPNGADVPLFPDMAPPPPVPAHVGWSQAVDRMALAMREFAVSESEQALLFVLGVDT